jgi:hypothetical protein
VLANLSTMGIGPDAAATLDLEEYEALLHHWNANASGEPQAVNPPDPATAVALLERLNADPRLTNRPAAP